MKQTECVAMLLAGGEGRRLGNLTANIAKPAVHFGGKYRIIDFTLSNCVNSGIDTVGVLTQYQPLSLHTHIGNGASWRMDRQIGGVTLLPSNDVNGTSQPYKGTANAVYQNMSFIQQYQPKYVLIISGDHIYNMDYQTMLDYHKAQKADATISVIEVKLEEASRFGIMHTNLNNRITDFIEKPAEPKSNLASMGIYIFNWEVLQAYLEQDERDPASSNDFGKDIIPSLLKEQANLYAYPFDGYWKDVGTVNSLWESHMDLLETNGVITLNTQEWPLYTNCVNPAPSFIAPSARISRSIVSDGCSVDGEIDHSVIFCNVEIGQGTLVVDSVIMPGAQIGKNVIIRKAIIGEQAVIRDGSIVGDFEGSEITVVGDKEIVLMENNKQAKRFIPRKQVRLVNIG
ncbi:MAG: glucose-1-phosphate adenylyltransferase [Gorillibacterium sp.]|nr:glucose-1-phosphate adenylyltransferase [Gorillibacterium sp.]